MDLSLDDLRKKIDEIDREIVGVLNKRAEFVKEIGRLKENSGSGFYAPHREKQVYERVAKLANGGLLPVDSVKEIYREIMSASLALEKHLRVAYLGPAGTFSHEAALRRFGRSVEFVPTLTFVDIFEHMINKEVDYGIVPVENSTDGGITHTLDLFVEYDVKVCSELLLPIRQNLLSNATPENIRIIYSRPQIFGQCKGWLTRMFPQCEQREVASSGKAAKMAAEDEYGAAIGSEEAARIYGLKVQFRGCEDRHNNTTRFFILGPSWGQPSGNDKTAFVFSVSDKVGALCSILEVFTGKNINLSKIESRPSRRQAWDYVFFVDVEGHVEDEIVRKAFGQIKSMTKFFKVLGSFPSAHDKGEL